MNSGRFHRPPLRSPFHGALVHAFNSIEPNTFQKLVFGLLFLSFLLAFFYLLDLRGILLQPCQFSVDLLPDSYEELLNDQSRFFLLGVIDTILPGLLNFFSTIL